MTNYSLRARMMILILAPTVLIGLLLSTFFVVHRYNDLQRQLEDAGASIIEPLAVSSEYGMALQNRESIGQLISILHRRHSDIVRVISVYDQHNRLFVTSNIQQDPGVLKLPSGTAFPKRLSVIRQDEKLILRTPILSESYSQDESAESDAKTNNNMLGYVALELDLKSVRLQQYREIFISTVMMLFCIGIALIFGWRLMRDVTSPIRNMVNTVDRIRRGQLDSRVEGFMLGELDMLKNGINSMAMSLAAYHEEMQHNVDQATSDLRETLEQMEIQNVELDLAKKRAQEAARIKSEFLANMSHELRTPLNGVIGFTRLTLKTELNPTQRDHLHTIERSANNLLAIINDVLDFSKLEAGKLILESIPFPLRNTLDEVVTLLAHSSHDKGLELTLNIKNDVPDNVIGDPLRLQQVITNLVGNAIKFTERGNIDVLVEKRAISNTKVQIEVQIRDTGIGIPERDQSRLFQAFRQADASISRRHGGTGLGLVITQKLVNEMGGDISFHSQPNRGSTFWFHINLDLNPNVLSDRPVMDCLQGKRLAYVEPNTAAAQSTLDVLSTTPLEVVYSPGFSSLPVEHYDILLMGIPVTFTGELTMQQERLAKAASMTDYLLLALPCHAQINAEELKHDGAAACLLKPLTATRLLPTLTEYCRLNYHAAPIIADESKLPMTVMAVDDNPANLKLIGALLEDQVQHVELCESGLQAVELAKQMQFDLIMMDIQMPGMDGIRACELIRQLPHQQQTPVVAVTAHAMAGQKEKLLSAGMNDYLAKPIEEEKLHTLLLRYKPGPAAGNWVAPAEAAEITVNENATLDWQLALRQAAGKNDLAREMLQMLVAFLPEIRNKVEEQLVGENPEDLVDAIHKLHGSCGYSGVPRLKNLCHLLEQQLRSGTPESELEPEFLELLDEMDNVTREAMKVLGS
ncbi:two-component sensor histidine kinase BarA [Leclercia adecarboxylata]|jgi:two-component system sensor histidine kinase BarA|uniref:two-component sensor histidine kinase BarA n=1 Tax=Leclercia adecarboxylata TaxID=83655 RepID=UPI00124EFC3B|nr:two-component sensor histidine kinase BarA [Leclercia adecarboxylata]MCE9984277.1 two-component sensor histidine kinase BarA [Leclercia adecarboxylata]MDH6163049.1 two-component system sensor histidine kinase BarA [Leclercia adecarboxylata]MDU1089128.1 two-component sensor histidine kinase BarA [Leclercia adecarboxylata]MDU6820049.1 two-component sensor histidine kinase BarA [Leclercia adecarboxylata]QFH51282.1 two-component sensor histidine kinase BarA [Leclercia adecarboxylata]